MDKKTYLRLSVQFLVDPGIFAEFIFMAEMNDLNALTITELPSFWDYEAKE